jgi:hypothetical protein
MPLWVSKMGFAKNPAESLPLFINAPVQESPGLSFAGGERFPARRRLLEDGSMGIRFRLR